MGVCCVEANQRQSAEQNELTELFMRQEMNKRKSASVLGDFKKSVIGNYSFEQLQKQMALARSQRKSNDAYKRKKLHKNLKKV